jgi:hypothetical protein
LVAQLHGVNVVPLIQMILIHVHLPFLRPFTPAGLPPSHRATWLVALTHP